MDERRGPVEEHLLVGPRAQLYWFCWGVLTMGVNVIELTAGIPGPRGLLVALMFVLLIVWAFAGSFVGWPPNASTGHRRR